MQLIERQDALHVVIAIATLPMVHYRTGRGDSCQSRGDGSVHGHVVSAVLSGI
jgi:hypothetical protein